MRRLFPLCATVLLAGCPLPGGAASAQVNTGALVIVPAGPGQYTVMGKPGCVGGGPATTVTLTVQRPQSGSPTPTPQGYRLAHLGNHLPVTSGYAVLAPDGSFPVTKLGDPDRPILPGDELDVTPEKGTEQAGYTAFITVP